MWGNRLTHTVTHTRKCAERAKEERSENLSLRAVFLCLIASLHFQSECAIVTAVEIFPSRGAV